MDPVLAYKEACSQRGTKALTEVVKALATRAGECEITSEGGYTLVCFTQTESDMACVGTVLRGDFPFLRELRVNGHTLSKSHLAALSAGLQSNTSLTTLDLSNNRITAADSVFRALTTARSLETLDLSHNQIDSEGVAGLCDLVEVNTSIKSIILDYNAVTTCELPAALGRSESVACFSISHNPLTFECLAGFLDALVNNRSLRYLGLAGCPQDGPAPIKENCDGLLSKREVVALKLAHVLRYSSLTSLSVDLDPASEVQLQELESTLVKHNRALTSLRCPQVDWTKIKSSGPLCGIYRALRANLWLSQNEQLPRDQRADPGRDIEELVVAKARRRGNESDSSLSSSETFQRLVSGRYQRSCSPTLLHSCDSAAPAVASPDAKPQCRLQELGEADTRSLGVTAETPQFSPYTSAQAFSQTTHKRAKKGSDTDAGIVRARSPAGEKRRAQDSATSFEMHTEPSLLHNSLDSRSPARDRPYHASPDLASRVLNIERKEQGLKRDFRDLAERMNTVENATHRQREELVDTQGNLEETQRLMKELSLRVEGRAYGKENELYDRLDAMERKEAAKVSLFQEIAKELDVLFTQALKSAQTNSLTRIQSLETQLKDEKLRNEHLLRLQNDRITTIERQLEGNKGRSAPPADLALISEQFAISRQQHEEDRELLISRLEAVEARDSQIEKVKRYIAALQKDLSAKVKKVEGGDLTVKKLELRVAAVEEYMGRYRDESGVGSLQSYPISPPISGRVETSHLSVASASQISRLEERVSDVEREVQSYSSLKKKMVEVLKRLKSIEQHSPRRHHSHAGESLYTKSVSRKRIDPSQTQALSPKSIRSTLTASKLLETATYAGEKKQRTVNTLPDEEIDTSFGVGEKGVRTERGLSDFLPGEAESVVVSALLERSRRGKPASTDIRYRSISPLTSQPPATKHGPGPSADLKDFLRQKGFSFS